MISTQTQAAVPVPPSIRNLSAVKANVALVTSPIIDGTAGETDKTAKLLARLFIRPVYDRDMSNDELVIAFHLSGTGGIVAHKCGKSVCFHHPDDLHGTGYARTADGKLINKGYGYVGPNGETLDANKKPWTEPAPGVEQFVESERARYFIEDSANGSDQGAVA